MGEDPFVAELEELPDPTHQTVMLTNPRRRDDRPLHYLERDTVLVIYPIHRINFIEVMPDEDVGGVDLFFRTD
jgi:hypothetical protein